MASAHEATLTGGKIFDKNRKEPVQWSGFNHRAVACTINVYDCKFYDRKLGLSLEHNYDRMIVILAMAS